MRGVVSGSATLTPNPVSTDLKNIDSSRGTTHMVLGGGGVSGTTNQAFFPVGKAKVITAVGAPPTAGAKHPSVYNVTYYNVTIPMGAITPLETFTLQRKRSDGRR